MSGAEIVAIFQLAGLIALGLAVIVAIDDIDTPQWLVRIWEKWLRLK